ncbi:MAG: metallophosphoesterase, partial [Flavobacteriaceae bacterium]
MSRRKFVSKTALALSAIPIPIMLHGVIHGRYNFKVIKHTLKFKNLPNEFNGYKLTHVSDFHCGSLENRKKIEYGVNLINQQKSDLILFTGDFVNNTFKEIEPWKGHFSKLKAKDGKFSVLGNHDYGDYYDWGSQDEKERNFNQLKEIQKKMGFNLLLDDSVYIEKNKQKIALIGVE